jgi:hypothetical protein
MSQTDLSVLEREVERARAKFSDDLARLRSPANLSRFKEDLWAEARDTKDELVEKGKEAAKDGMQRIVTELKERAAANPAAAIAIGAGLAWRLVHRPPIATLLVGVGLVGLLRTSPAQQNSQPYLGLHDEDPKIQSAAELAKSVQEKVEDWGARAGDAARETTARIADQATAMADRASNVLRDAGDAARQTMSGIADNVASVAEQASHTLHDAVPDREDRDRILLGVAALAVAAAVGIACQRRSQEQSSP